MSARKYLNLLEKKCHLSSGQVRIVWEDPPLVFVLQRGGGVYILKNDA
jgi:hypothetical protein